MQLFIRSILGAAFHQIFASSHPTLHCLVEVSRERVYWVFFSFSLFFPIFLWCCCSISSSLGLGIMQTCVFATLFLLLGLVWLYFAAFKTIHITSFLFPLVSPLIQILRRPLSGSCWFPNAISWIVAEPSTFHAVMVHLICAASKYARYALATVLQPATQAYCHHTHFAFALPTTTSAAYNNK